jgi:phosphoglycerate dehydrogenase-like enzyme
VLVALARRFRAAVVEQTTTGMRRENWWVGSEIPDELHGKTLGLFGYGAIGREVARRAIGFGMRVVALRRHPDRAPEWDPELLRALGLPLKEPDVEAVLGPADFARLLGESDAVVACAALTPETKGIFNADAFARMRPGSWFVNVARGKMVREDDLIAALRGGPLGGAALDVFETEPLPHESALYTLGNVILTPHVSGLSRGFWPRAMAIFRANLVRDAKALPLLNVVDPERGY